MVYPLTTVSMPRELVAALKMHATVAAPAFLQSLQQAPALKSVLEQAFVEFNGARVGLEKVLNLLGWSHFRDRVSSVYIFKALHGHFPCKTDMELVEDILTLEGRFTDKFPAGNSRLFLLGLYLKLHHLAKSEMDGHGEGLGISREVDRILSLRMLRTERPDLLILLVSHLESFFGLDRLVTHIDQNKNWPTIYQELEQQQRQILMASLLAYGCSIQEMDTFLYERI